MHKSIVSGGFQILDNGGLVNGGLEAAVSGAPRHAVHIVTGGLKVLFHVSFSTVQNSIVTGVLKVSFKGGGWSCATVLGAPRPAVQREIALLTTYWYEST